MEKASVEEEALKIKAKAEAKNQAIVTALKAEKQAVKERGNDGQWF